MINSGSERGPLRSQRALGQSQSGWKQVQVLGMRTKVRIWTLIPNTVEYTQHLITIPPGDIEANFKNPCPGGSRTPGQEPVL